MVSLKTLLAIVLLNALVSFSLGQSSSSTNSKSQTLTFAPEVELINGNDDIDPNGNCMAEIKKFCSEMTAGEGRLANCISDQIAESEMPNAETESTVTDACREEVYQFKIQRNSNINLNVPLAKACKVDAEQFCNVTWMFGYKAGQVISCLKDVKDRLAPACKKLITQVQIEAAQDYRADVDLHEACKSDADKLCKDIKVGGGRVQACLRDHRLSLSWDCVEKLFKQEMENADDIRLSVRLFSNCLPDKKRFCADVEPGSSRVKDCLEKHRNEKGFTAACKVEIDAMLERRVHDFRLDSRLRTACKNVIDTQCAFYVEDSEELDQPDGSVINCLQDFVDEIADPLCRTTVKKYQDLAAEDVRFNTPLAEACYNDRMSFCKDVPPGSARVIRCLMKTRDRLSSQCRAVLFDEEVRFSQNIDFQYPLRAACKSELDLFCKDVPHGEARAIRCLQDHKDSKDMSKECKEQIRDYENEASSDYRFNHRLTKSCKNDISALCANVCKAEEGQVCGGAVLRCLTEKREQIKSDACRHEVFYFTKMEVTDYRNDVILAAACRADVEKFCAKIEPGEGRIHDCLRSNRAQLSEECRREELLLEEMEAENVELRPGVMRACKDERHMFCKGVIPGGARMFRCLAEKMGDVDFGETCRNEITNKLRRRQANWKLDPPLRKACKSAVTEFCASVDSQHQERGLVYKCLAKNYEDLDPSCQKELGRAYHMAFFIWAPGQILTQECDADIQSQCLTLRPNMDKSPGAVGTCLATIVEEMAAGPADAVSTGSGPSAAAVPRRRRSLADGCRQLADISQPPDMKKAFEASLSVVVLQGQLSAMESVTGVKMLNKDRHGNARSVTLTGWTAILGMAAMVVLIIWSAGYGYRKYRGIPEDSGYTLVVKKSHK